MTNHRTSYPAVTLCEPPLENPHRWEPAVHYRLYLTADGEPTTVCVQDFDYLDYDDARFLSTDMWLDETDALAALSQLIANSLEQIESRGGVAVAATLAALGAPMTRSQAVDAYALRASNRTQSDLRLDAGVFAVHLRRHAFEGVSPDTARELMRMADRLDGGTGDRVHHGCPDETVPTADCTECWMVLEIEVRDGEHGASIFADRGRGHDS